MKKITGSFTGIRFLPTASLYLEKNKASISLFSRGFFSKKEVRKEFRAENFSEVLKQVSDFLRNNPPSRMTVILNHSFFLERTVFLPFRRRKTVSLVLPGELTSLLPSPLSDYFYDFVMPENEHLPLTVFLLPAEVHQSITKTFPKIPIGILPLDIALSRHPAVSRFEKTLLLLSGKNHSRLLLFFKGKFVMGRSFNSTESDYQKRLAEEKRLLLHSSRLPEIEAQTILPDEIIAFKLPLRLCGFALRKGGLSSRSKIDSLLYVAAGALILLWVLFFAALKAKTAALLSYRKVSEELAQQQKEMVQADGISLSSLFSDKNVTLLLQEELSPLETFSRFSEALPHDLPLVLDYLQIDRQKLVLNGKLATPGQVDTLINALKNSGYFQEIVLGELKIESGSVKFPLSAKIVAAQKHDDK